MDTNQVDADTALFLRTVEIVKVSQRHAVAAVAMHLAGLGVLSLRPDTVARKACLTHFYSIAETHAFEAAYIGMVLMLAEKFNVPVVEAV